VVWGREVGQSVLEKSEARDSSGVELADRRSTSEEQPSSSTGREQATCVLTKRPNRAWGGSVQQRGEHGTSTRTSLPSRLPTARGAGEFAALGGVERRRA